MSERDPIKVYDARWETGEFSDDEVRRLFEATLAYGRLLDVDTVTLTRDARHGAGRVVELGSEVALRMGFRLYVRLEPISTPQSYYTTLFVSEFHRHTMGLTITASHNPKEYVGIKFTVPVVQAIGLDCGPLGGLTKIRELYHSPEQFPRARGGCLQSLDLGREYVDFSLGLAGIEPGDLAGIGVVLDCFHGAAGPELFAALSRAGARVEPLRMVPDGNFPSGSPNPTSRGKMEQAVQVARERECDAAVGLDGDGDRIVFAGQQGVLSAGFAFLPVLRACVAGQPSARLWPVLYDPKVNPIALAEWAKLHVRPVLFRNGHSQIKDYMNGVEALAAAEESGHYYHRITRKDLSISCENSILTVLLFLGSLKKRPQLMEELWELQERVFTTGEFNYQFDCDETRDRAMAAVIDHCVRAGASTTTATPDGVDLQGTCLQRGVHFERDAVKLDPEWYCGYLRVATNERSVVRSYFSAGDAAIGRGVEAEARRILETDFTGAVVD